MKINKYSFGKMVIDGKFYDSDLLIFNDKIKPNWWREEGHSLCLNDLKFILNKDPDVFIMGTGNSGVLTVPNPITRRLKELGIKVIIEKTPKAVKTYNKLIKERSDQNIAAGFHLTC